MGRHDVATATHQIEVTFPIRLVRTSGPEPSDPDLVLRWLTESRPETVSGGLEADERGRLIVQACPEHDPDDEPADVEVSRGVYEVTCRHEAAVYEVLPADSSHTESLLPYLEATATLLAGEPVEQPELLAEWLAVEGLDWEGWPSVPEHYYPGHVIVNACPVHPPNVEPRYENGVPACDYNAVYSIQVNGANWTAG